MFSWAGLAVVIALGVAGWAGYLAAVYFAAAQAAEAKVRAARLELVTVRLKAADEEAGRITALRLLDELTQVRAAETQAFAARLEVLEHKYGRVLELYREATAIDGPLGSRRVQ